MLNVVGINVSKYWFACCSLHDEAETDVWGGVNNYKKGTRFCLAHTAPTAVVIRGNKRV